MKSADRLSSLLLLLPFILLFKAPPSHAQDHPLIRHQVELGGGLYVPFGSENRDNFGTGIDVNFGFASSLGWKSTWIVLDATVIHSKGDDFFDDGTFDPPQSSYTVVPILFGVRTNAASDGEHLPVRLYLGTGFLTVFSTYKPPLSESSSTPTFGAMFELRPEISLGKRSSLYFRQRAIVMLDADYDIAFRTLNYSGTTLDAGLTWRLR